MQGELNCIQLYAFTNVIDIVILMMLLVACISDEKLMYRTSYRYYLLWLVVQILCFFADTFCMLAVSGGSMPEPVLKLGGIMVWLLSYTTYYIQSLWMLELVRERKVLDKKRSQVVFLVFTGVWLLICALVFFVAEDINAIYRGTGEIGVRYWISVLCGYSVEVSYLLYIAVVSFGKMNWREIGFIELAMLISLAGSVLVLYSNVDITNGVKTVVLLAVYIWIWSERKSQLERNEYELENAQAKAMLAQIKPHFLYNSLTTIAGLCEEDPQRAREITLDFAKYLRHNTESFGKTVPISFREELEHTNNYLAIEQARFDDKIRVEYDIQAENFALPVLTLQPLVENAVKHGICKRDSGGTLRIATCETEQNWIITVQDDGVGFDVTEIDWADGTHVGIDNAQKRLQQLCNGTLRIESRVGAGTVATVELPKNDKP